MKLTYEYCILIYMKKYHWKKLVAENVNYHVGRNPMIRSRILDVHTHDFAEVFLVESGAGTHVVGQSRVRLQERSLVMLQPPYSHGFISDHGNRLVLVNIAFTAKTLSFIRDRYFSPDHPFFSIASERPFQTRLSEDQARWFVSSAAELSRLEKSLFRIERFLMNLIHMISGVALDTYPPESPAWLRSALERIREPDYFRRGINGLVEAAGCSREHVSRTVHRLLNTTPSVLVNDARLEYAAMRLSMSGESILDICFDCGFDSVPYFYKRFKEKYRLTPRQYRLRSRSVFE